MQALFDGLSHQQYYQQCQQEGLPTEDYQDVPYPHPYIEIWLECRRHANSVGVPMLPEPDKGPLDQDADLMLGFDILEELMRERETENELRRKNQEQARTMGFGLPLS